MNLTPRERDKLVIGLAALVARERLARGVKLNYPESMALITDFVMEHATASLLANSRLMERRSS
jgi:urease subunit gamma